MKKPRKRKSTQTSAFGSPGRVSHDASAFYNGRMYRELRQGEIASQGALAMTEQIASQGALAMAEENPVPEGVLDAILCKSSENMHELPDRSVHLVITSPPYNVGKEYDHDLTLTEYLAYLQRVWKEVRRVLTPGGRMCINVANLGRKPYLPMHLYIAQSAMELGFLMRGEIIWNKAASASPSTAWGSWQSAANPTLRDVHEYILVFCKDQFRRKPSPGRENTITKEQFLEYTKSVWTFPAESARKVGHPAPFPLELPTRLIQLYTFSGEVVLDPFMGSGQSAIAAKQAGRHFVGYEIDPHYVELAKTRIFYP